jgi:hypothetical protein
VNSKGAPRYTTRRWIDVTNTGGLDAEEVTFEAYTDDNKLMMLMGPSGPTTIHKGQTWRIGVTYSAAGSDEAVLRVRWSEGGTAQEKDFHVG